MRIKTILLFLVLINFASCRSLSSRVDTNKLGTIERDVTYCTMAGVALKMDIYYPLSEANQWPVVIYVHGGEWVSGSKDKVIDVVDTKALQTAGFLTASVEYRLAPEHKFPAMIEDVKCAVRFLRAHASEYNIDSSHMGAIGDSAGGHLVSLLGVTDNKVGFDVGEYLNYSSRVQAVVDLYGPSDLASQHVGYLLNFDEIMLQQ